MPRREYKGGPRRIRTNRVPWLAIQTQQTERDISNADLAEMLGVRPPYISRLNGDAADNEGCVNLTQQQVSRLREAGFALQIRSSPQLKDALSRMWETLLALPHVLPEPETLADELSRYAWDSLMLEIDTSRNNEHVLRELPEYLARLRRHVGIANWHKVARAIGLGIVHVWQSDKPSLTTRDLVIRLLEQDVRHPLVVFSPSWEHSVIAGESAFAGLQSLAVRSHVESRGCSVRIGLDAWPGYVPLWAARQELRNHGIAILFIEDSATKMRLLREGQVDVIGTTPGGLLLRKGTASVPQLQVLAILNRSNGADLVLHRPTRRPIRNPAQKPRAAVTAGSTSELLFRAFTRNHEPSKPIECVPVPGYISAARAILQDHLIEYVSTWEPYGTLLRDIVPDLQVVASTSHNDLDLVADYLVSVRERTGRPLRDSMAILLSVWDRVITTQEYLQPEFLQDFSRECAISLEACKRMLHLVSFFTTQEMAWRLRHQVLTKQFKNVAQVVGLSLAETDRRWTSLLEPVPPWLQLENA